MRIGSCHIVLSVLLFSAGVFGQSVPATAPPPVKVTPSGPQRQEPPAREASNPIAKAPAPIPAPGGAGTIEGFVYWDATNISHLPASSCSGLAITVSVGSSSGGPLVAYTPMGTLSNIFKYVGQVKEFLAGGKVALYDVCTYGYSHVPVGPDLQVKLTVTQSTAFTPFSQPQFSNLGPIKIINGQCNMLPNIANPTASDLAAHWGSCQNMAYDVNFVMQPNAHLMSSGGSAGPSSGTSGAQGMLSGPSAQGMLATPGTLNGGAQVSSQGGARPSPGSTVQLNPQPLPPRQMLTNADVINMVKAGVPQSAIVTSIQSSPAKFDLSPKGLAALRRAGVNEVILGTMQAGGGDASGSGTSSNGQAGAGRAANGKPAAIDPSLLMKLGPAKISAPVKNTHARAVNGAVIAALKKQRSAADVEASQMKLSLRPEVQAGPAGGSQLMSATGGVKSSPPGAASSSAASNISGPGTVKGGSGNIPATISHVPYFNATALTCAHDPTFRIINVSGSAGPATFTPIDQYNLYTITGCSFGNPGSNDKVYIYGAGSFQGNFAIKFWSDNSIAITLDESITGHPDLSNITLVVQRNDGQQTQKPGFKFYAFRQAVPLNTIPSSWAKLANLTSGFATLSPQYSSPPSSSPGPGPSAGTSYVNRFYNGKKFDPTGHSDYYDFSQLAAGWTTDSFQVTTYPQNCVWVVTYKHDFGNWHWDWDGNNPNNIRVWFSDTTCSGFNPSFLSG